MRHVVISERLPQGRQWPIAAQLLLADDLFLRLIFLLILELHLV